MVRIFRAAVPALAAFFVAASPAMAATIHVSVGGTDQAACGTGGANPDCATIHGALDTSPAANGDTIQVAAGTYSETATLTVDKPVTIAGAGVGSTTITTPFPTSFTQDAAGNFAMVFVAPAASGATIQDLTVNANGDSNTNHSCPHSFVGVDIQDAAATVQRVHIANVEDTPLGGSPCGGTGLSDLNDDGTARTLTVDHVTIDNYEKNGMSFDGNDVSGLTANVTNSTVTGAGPTTILAQNGIEYLSDAAGTVSGSTISGDECNVPGACGPDPFTQSQGTGILLFATGPVTVSGNTITANDTGITYFLSDSGVPTISGNVLSGNRFQGVLLEQGTANLTGNTISGSNIGVQLASFDTGDTGNVVASLTGNTISGNVTGISLDDSNSTTPTFFPVLTAENNVISLNSTSGIANNVAEPQDATYNYWGCSGGPFTAGCDGPTGSAAAMVSYIPFLTSASPAPPTISKVFGASSISVGASTSLTFTIRNPNSGAQLTGVAVSDALPSGLVVSTPNGLTGSCGGGAITAVAGSSSISLSGATLAASASCTFAVNVTATSSGTKINTTGPVTSTESGAGSTASATLTVQPAGGPPTGIAPPTMSKVFGASSISVGASTSLTFTIRNPNSGAQLTGVAVSDALPSGLVVSTPNGLTGSCGGGAITAVAGSSSISLSGATLAASASCTFAVNVTATSSGTKINTTGPVTSTESGAGSTASATLTVQPPPGGIGPPTVSIVTPPRGAVYKFGQSVRANYSCHEASGGPGIQSCAGSVASGSRVKTSRAGTLSFTVVAKSKDGQSTVRTVRYKVRPDNRFKLTDLKLHASDGSVTFTLKLPGPGVVDVLETARKSNEITARKAAALLQPARGRFVFARLHLNRRTGGTIAVVVNPGNRGTRLVHHHRGKVFIRLWVTYTPTGGSTNTIGLRGLLLIP